MKNVLILGAGGNIAGKVIDMLSNEDDIHMSLFLRKAVARTKLKSDRLRKI
jgi:saccharopine dehydrogenase-like NADP-dependent oxidoreductase